MGSALCDVFVDVGMQKRGLASHLVHALTQLID